MTHQLFFSDASAHSEAHTWACSSSAQSNVECFHAWIDQCGDVGWGCIWNMAVSLEGAEPLVTVPWQSKAFWQNSRAQNYLWQGDGEKVAMAIWIVKPNTSRSKLKKIPLLSYPVCPLWLFTLRPFVQLPVWISMWISDLEILVWDLIPPFLPLETHAPAVFVAKIKPISKNVTCWS